MPVKNNTNIGFEKQIWDAACVLWGHIPAADSAILPAEAIVLAQF